MRFLTPIAFAFAAVLPVVVAFYLLKRKRVTRLVPSTVLWQRFLSETQASAPFQKLRHNWLLLFQLLMLCLIILAMARPYFAGTVRSGGLQVIVLDASASMQATDEVPNRFERARAGALRLVDALGESGVEQMAVLVSGAQTEVRQSRTSNKSDLRRALESARVTDSTTRVVDALRVAESLTRNEAMAEIHLFSDGAVPDLSEFETKDLRMVFHKVGQRVDNLGVVSLDIKANPEDPSQRAIFTSVANFSERPRDIRLDLLFEDTLVETKLVTVGATNTSPIVFLAGQDRDGVFRVRMNIDDDLAVDNEASRVSLMPQPVRVLLVSGGNRFLERALAAAGSHVEVEIAGDYTSDMTVGHGHDVVVLDEINPTVWPETGLLAFAVGNTNWFDGDLGMMEAPPIVDWRSTHPLLRFVSFDNVQIAQSLAVPRSSWAVPLVESPQSALILAGELGRQRIVWVGFNPLESTWPLRISFPIFIANSVDWLNPASAREELFSLRPGETFRYPLTKPEAEARITLPDQSVERVSLGDDVSELVFGRTHRQGVYRVELGTNRLVFAASLLDAGESNIRPRESISLGRFTEVEASREKRASLEYWRWFVLGGLAVLSFEWWWFHRRTA
jgi:hypothetical protein